MISFGNHNCPKLMPIVLVYGIIIFEYVIFMTVFIPVYLKNYGISAVFLGLEFSVLYALLHIAYYQCQRVSPGTLSSNLAKHYHSNTLEEIKTRTKKNNTILQNQRKRHLMRGKQSHAKYRSNIELAEEQLEDDDENFDIMECLQLVSYCFKCQNIKLPRAHHCKECNMCVLRMDHHCPWVNNCIGLKNHKFFCQFTFYAITCMIQCTYFIAADYLFYEGIISKSLPPNYRLLVSICGATCFALTLALSFLLGFQLWHIARNITTVEFHVKEIFIHNPFSKSTKCENLKEVLGEEIKHWFIPFQESFMQALPRNEFNEV